MSKMLTMLNAKSIKLDGMPPGGIPRITPDMVAAALINLKPIVREYGLAKYAGHEDYELKRLHLILTAQTAIDEKWIKKATGWRVVFNFADMALDEALGDNLCQRCKGAGAHNNRKTCVACEGSGRGKELSITERAEKIGVTEYKWKTYWQERLAKSAGDFAEYDEKIRKELNRQIFGD